MRKIRWSALALVAAVGAGGAGAATLEEILGKAVEARGGLEKLRAVQSYRMKGKISAGGGQFEAPFQMEWKRPDKIRIEFTFQGMTGVQAFDGQTAWAVMPFMGDSTPQRLPDDQVESLREQGDFEGPYVDGKAKGYGIEYLGEDEVEGTPVHKLRVTNKRGEVSYHYLDAESFVPLKVVGKREVRGQEIEGETVFGDYKTVEGIVFPFSIENRIAGGPAGGGQILTVESVELNVDLADDRFRMPQTPAPAAQPEGGGNR